MDNPIETIEYRNCNIKIYQDDSPENPRVWDNLGTMVCFHRRYKLGDKHNFSDSQELMDYLKHNKTLYLLLHLLDHSGLRMSTRDFNYCDPGQWDSGQVGIIYVDYERIRKEYSVKHVTKKIAEKVYSVLHSEVNVYDDYLSGNVYGFVAEDQNEEHIDSCFGFFGDTGYMIDQAKESIDYHILSERKKHFAQVKLWVKNHVPLSIRKPMERGLTCI